MLSLQDTIPVLPGIVPDSLLAHPTDMVRLANLLKDAPTLLDITSSISAIRL
jgi:hypothetical protein